MRPCASSSASRRAPSRSPTWQVTDAYPDPARPTRGRPDRRAMPHPADASPPRRLDPRRAAGIREDRTNPRRIDIMMKNKRMFQLAVPSAEERPPW